MLVGRPAATSVHVLSRTSIPVRPRHLSYILCPPLVSGTCVFVVPVYERSQLCGKPDGLHLHLHQQLDRTLLH